MVFHSLVQSTETTPPPPPLSQQQPPVSMASPITVKSQQQQQSSLHNFVLPELKWTVSSNVNAYRSSRNYQSPPPPPPPRRNEAGSDSEKTEKSEKKKSDADSASDGGRTKFVIRIRSKNSKVADEADHVSAAEEAEYMVPKSWNFRPRKAVTKTKVNNGYGNGGAGKIGGAAKATQGPTPSVKAPAAKNNNEKPKFSILLTKEEIEEDFLAMTGSKPPRKAQKRARSVQKQLDYVFPGLWLDSITPDSYRVDDGRSKF